MAATLSDRLGFTLIELMIVIAIISILASMAIPNYLNFTCITKQGEAKDYLGVIARCEEAYFVEHNTYSTDKDKIGFYTIGSPFYTYEIISANEHDFKAEASAYYRGQLDKWIIDSRITLENNINACKN